MAVGSQLAEASSSSSELPHLFLPRANASLKIANLNSIGFSVKGKWQTFEPTTQFEKQNISSMFEVYSVTLFDHSPSLLTWENQYLEFCVNNFLAFSFNNMYFCMTQLLFCTILTIILMESYCVFGDLVFIQYCINYSKYL